MAGGGKQYKRTKTPHTRFEKQTDMGLRFYRKNVGVGIMLNLTISEALEANGVTHTLPDKNRKRPGKPVGNILCRIMVRARLRRIQNGIYDQFELILNLLKE